MQFDRLDIAGAFTVRFDSAVDERGAFIRVFSAREFAERGLVDRFAQHSLSLNSSRGTVRGIHYQAAPHLETKLVRCARGIVFDVIVDLRRTSATYRRWCGMELSAAGLNAVYIPQGCAHGFQTLVDDCTLEYLITPDYVPAAARGIRWDDPSIAVAWPIRTGIVISERDRNLPTLDTAEAPT